MHDPDSRTSIETSRFVWSAVTIRVSWELYMAGVKASPAVLHEARDHVLLSLPRGSNRSLAEELAGTFMEEWLGRVQDGRYRWRPPTADPLVPRPSWRERLLEALDPIGEVVLRLVYGDGLALTDVERITRVDRVILEGARGGVRSALRCVMAEDDVGLVHPESDLLDRLLSRVARLPAADCQGGWEAATPDGWLHAERCPRCARAVRLIRAGVLSPSEISPDNARDPSDQASVLALHLHPDARGHRKALVEVFGSAAIRADDDAVLVDPDRIDDHVALISQLALEGTPERSQIRGALVRGPGRWTRTGVIGPVGAAAVERIRERPWAEVDGCGVLPEKLPEPPPAARWWAGAALACMLAVLAGVFALRDVPPEPSYPVLVEAIRDGALIEANLGVHDDAYLLVVARQGEEILLLHASEQPWDKARYATGEGDYSLAVEADEVLVASSAAAFDEVDLAAANLAVMVLQIQSSHEDADIFVHTGI